MFIFSNLATSIDGKIATASRAYFPLGTEEDRKRMQVLRRRADAVLMGASSLRTFKRPLLVTGRGPRQPKQILNVILSSGLAGISPRWEFFRNRTTRRVLFITQAISPARRREFERTSELVRLNPRRPVAPQMIRELEARGVRRLLVEGGGSVMWDFISEDRLDELNVTLTPRILGGSDAPTLVEGTGFTPAEARSFRLKSCRKRADELYLVYARRSRKP